MEFPITNNNFPMYLYEALKVPYSKRLDFPCVYGGHCDDCPSHTPWDMAPFMKSRTIVMVPDRKNKRVTFILSYKLPNGDYQLFLEAQKTFILPDCLKGFQWLLDFVGQVYLSAMIDAKSGHSKRPQADWEFRSYFPEWDKHFMCRYFLTGEKEV